MAKLPPDNPPTRQQKADATTPLLWGTPVGYLKGVGPKRTEKLAELGLRTVGDLISHYPLRHEDRRSPLPVRQLQHRQHATLDLRIAGPGRVTGRFGRTVAEVPATDGSDEIKLLWFNQPYRAGQFEAGQRLVASGSAHLQGGRVALIVGEYERLFDDPLPTAGLTPIYPSAAGMSQSVMRALVAQALDRVEQRAAGLVPLEVQERRRLDDFGEALRVIHAPTTMLEANAARHRLTYEKLFLHQAALAQRRRRVKQPDSGAAIPAGQALGDLAAALPFALTKAQERVIREVLADLEEPEPMHRLVHGDVGSGKTVVAAAALLVAVRAGRQGAMMAPTELLAEQQFEVLKDMLRDVAVEVLLLTGSMVEASKRKIRSRLESGEPLVVVGTQTLFQSSVRFNDLALAVVDEQHRFGVKQRAALSAKGAQPNVLAMSATPIPRTLALTLYGDFDISVLDELPPGRRPVTTELMSGRERLEAYDFIIKSVGQGRQAYIVCAVIAENEHNYLKGAEKHFAMLREHHMPTVRLGLVHGEMEAEQRRAAMEQFRAGELDVLVATNVIEVGVDVPNATVMMVENAERFGLSQLHQLRGRVGRASQQAHCLLVSNVNKLDIIERLQVLVRTTDGFEVAREDLQRRGPGELAGIRQHGLPDLRMAELLSDTAALAEAREDAFGLLEDDPELRRPEHAALRRALKRLSDEDWVL